MVIGINRGGIILICKRSQRYVVVEEVLLPAVGELAEELLESGGVMVDVKCEIGVVVI